MRPRFLKKTDRFCIFSFLLKTQRIPWISHVFFQVDTINPKGPNPASTLSEHRAGLKDTYLNHLLCDVIYVICIYRKPQNIRDNCVSPKSNDYTMKITSLGTLQLRLQISASSLICWSLFAFFLRNGGGKWEISSRCKVTGESVSECM